MNHSNELTEIVDDYIGPLITYDNEHGTELLRTFQVYLKNLGAKNETARELFIVRQTLYHRLKRIKQLIGDDYMQPKRSEEHTSELQSRFDLVCRLLLEKKKQ